ncbi:MAG: ATP-binding protein [Terrimicrobiaceae bacterium]|nr:ATP-binding protein [Terrimicrobiaceae bacterium]
MIAAILLAAAAPLAGWLLWRSWVRPLLDLRDLIRAIANDEPHAPIVRSSLRPFTQISADLGRVADRQRRQRRQLADEGFSLRAILGSMIEGVIIVDPPQRIRLANDALHTMFELTQPPINRTVIEVFHHPELAAAIERAFREVRSIVIELHDAPRIGESRPDRHYRVNLAPLMPVGGSTPAGVLGVFNDITEVRALEAVRREFVANVSHEFRTPLAIIGGYVETLLDGALDDRPMAEHSLRTIQKHSERLNLLIEDLLAISRIEHRQARLDCRVASVREILQRVIEQLDPRIREREATVELALDADLIEMDPARIEQVFFNLLANALQYAVADGMQVRVTSRLRGAEVEIVFADNGPGIPYRDQPHVFERFYRVHKDRSRDAGGTGLGLSIVKNVVMAHGGRVSVRSTPGAGASFRIVLPVHQQEG